MAYSAGSRPKAASQLKLRGQSGRAKNVANVSYILLCGHQVKANHEKALLASGNLFDLCDTMQQAHATPVPYV